MMSAPSVLVRMVLESAETFEGVRRELVDEAAIDQSLRGGIGLARCLVAHARAELRGERSSWVDREHLAPEVLRQGIRPCTGDVQGRVTVGDPFARGARMRLLAGASELQSSAVVGRVRDARVMWWVGVR